MSGVVTAGSHSAAEVIRSLCGPDRGPLPAPAAVIVAHPDDEVIGIGSRLPRLRGATFIYLTDGAPANGRDAAAAGFARRSDYARARWHELVSALALTGIDSTRARCLGCPDQCAATRLAELTLRLAGLLTELQPAVVLTQPYEGGHPDHDATAFVIHAAVRLLSDQPGVEPPAVVEMTAYHMGPEGIEPCGFLPCRGPHVSRGVSGTVELSDRERAFKSRLLDCFPSQRETLRYFRPPAVERFRPAPLYDFTRPPHDGRLFYEHFPWGTTGPAFRARAAAAMNELGIGGPL